MKKYTYIYIAMLAFIISACEDDAEKVMISSSPVAPELTSPGANGLSFEKDDAANSIDFAWNEADFGFDASVTYTVELALANSFEGSAEILSSGSLIGSALVGDINAVLLSLELPINEVAEIHTRVVATVNENVAPVYSEVSTFTVTPYETLIDYPMIYVPGAYQVWSPGAEDGRLYSYEFNTVYAGFVRVIDAAAADATANTEFKITPAANWDNAWGGSLTATADGYTGTLDGSGGNFSVAPGVYKFSVDTEGLTITLTKSDDWAIIGSATPNEWNDPDTDMFYNGQRQKWEVTTDLTDGELKFRANNGWDLNLGDNDADGSLEGGGANIAVSAGNYTIRLDVANSTYDLIAN